MARNEAHTQIMRLLYKMTVLIKEVWRREIHPELPSIKKRWYQNLWNIKGWVELRCRIF